MWSNPFLVVFNILIGIFVIISLYLLYKIASLSTIKDKQQREIKDSYIRTKHKSGQRAADFEPFYFGDGRINSANDEYMKTLFEEFAKIYEEKERAKEQEFNPAFHKVKSFPECYKILGFKQTPESEEAIKKQYRNLAKALHPDVGGSEEMFIRVNQAYDEAIRIWNEQEL